MRQADRETDRQTDRRQIRERFDTDKRDPTLENSVVRTISTVRFGTLSAKSP